MGERVFDIINGKGGHDTLRDGRQRSNDGGTVTTTSVAAMMLLPHGMKTDSVFGDDGWDPLHAGGGS